MPLAAKKENENEPEDVTSQEKFLGEIPTEMKVTSQKFVTLRDDNRYFMLRYNEQGQARLRRQVPHSDISDKINQEASNHGLGDVSKKPHFTHTTQKGELIFVHLLSKPGHRYETIEVQRGVYILVVGIEAVANRENYQIAIAGDYLAVKKKTEGRIFVQKFDLENNDYERK